MELGLYDYRDGHPLLTLDGRQFVTVGSIAVD